MRLFKRHENQRLPSEAELRNVRDRVQSIRQRSLAGAGSLSELFSAIAEDDQWAVDNAPRFPGLAAPQLNREATSPTPADTGAPVPESASVEDADDTQQST